MDKETNDILSNLKSKISIGIKIWLKFEDESILGSGWANLLENIENNNDGSLAQATKECGYSYKYAWNILKRIEKRTGKSPVITGKGGKGGGGWIKLNEWGEYLLKIYKDAEIEVELIGTSLNRSKENESK